jgi:ferredoxin-like protein FixX
MSAGAWAHIADRAAFRVLVPPSDAARGRPRVNDPDVCLHCPTHQCVGACPVGCYGNRPDGRIELDLHGCMSCGACVVVCDEFFNIRWRAGPPASG